MRKKGKVVDMISNGDRIRAMSDEELAVLFERICSERDREMLKKLHNFGISEKIALCEMPYESRKQHLDWLKQSADMEGLYGYE